MENYQQDIISHFGEMGSRWGFNRTVGQVMARLLLANEALAANTLADELMISRGNVSMAIKELQSWQLVNTVHKPGDRKDYYQVSGNVTSLAIKVMEQRRKRELEPTLSLLRNTVLQAPKETNLSVVNELLTALESLNTAVDELLSLSPESLQLVLKAAPSLTKVLALKDKWLKE
ncbi:GbsR/MarR family transcriptional regulator [Paraferrimonas sp. SM1919]|uniref:GbsR/MarR family transcriptional regulator n=1 Tax=Paraferrimonas sp. SM1919 TaxID=2662263 RepID=UPI0013D1FE72|nr:MarR family transcriptional regulator [Paraferrimonas sp. SM1919]